MLFLTQWDPNFCGWIVTHIGFMCEYTDQDFLRLRLETLQVTLRFMCPFSEIFYLVHSLLILLQCLRSFGRPNKTIKAISLLISLARMSALSHNAKLASWNISWKPIYYHNNQKYSLLSGQWHHSNKMMSLWSASGSPKVFGLDLSKNLRRQIQCFITACHHTKEASAFHL